MCEIMTMAVKKYELRSSKVMPEAMWQLYRDSFPVEERRDEVDLQQLIESGVIDLRLIVEPVSGHPVGFVTLWSLPLSTGTVVNYVEHLAILPDLRGCGVGSMAVREIVRLGVPVVLEVEPPEDVQALRRISFYQRNGLELHPDFDYWQPPYGPGLNGLSLCLMSCGVSAQELGPVRDLLYKYVYKYEADC